MEEFWIWFNWKQEAKTKIYIIFESFFFFNSRDNFEITVQICQPII